MLVVFIINYKTIILNSHNIKESDCFWVFFFPVKKKSVLTSISSFIFKESVCRLLQKKIPHIKKTALATYFRDVSLPLKESRTHKDKFSY